MVSAPACEETPASDPQPATSEFKLIYELLPKVMESVGVVGKDGFNKDQKYEFRRAEDLQNAVHAALVKHGVIHCPVALECDLSEFKTPRGKTQTRALVKVEHSFIAPDGSRVTLVTFGEGADALDKAVNKAHTSSLKTALTQGLMIPTEEVFDSEADSPEAPADPPTQSREPDIEYANKDDFEQIKEAVYTRCEMIGLDPKQYDRVCMMDCLAPIDLTFETRRDLPTDEIVALIHRIGDWNPRDDSPPANGDDIPF